MAESIGHGMSLPDYSDMADIGVLNGNFRSIDGYLTNHDNAISTLTDGVGSSVQTSGGTMRGALRLQSDDIDRGASPETAVNGTSVTFADGNAYGIGGIIPSRDENGVEHLRIAAYNGPADGQVENFIRLSVDGNGSATYAVSDPASFRRAIGALSYQGDPITGPMIFDAGGSISFKSGSIGDAAAETDFFPLGMKSVNSATNGGLVRYKNSANFKKWLNITASDIASGTLDAARIPNLAASKITSGTMSALRVHRIYYQGTGGSSQVTVNDGDITRIPLTGQHSSGDASVFSLSNGGIKVSVGGRYMISASVYITNATGQNGRGCFVVRTTNGGAYPSSPTTTQQILQALQYSESKAGAVPTATKVVELAANDIVYLAARSQGANTTAGGNGGGTFLLIERLS